jgi:hypothetical protein
MLTREQTLDDTVSFVQEIRSESPDYPYRAGGLATTGHKNLRFLSLRAKRSNLPADMGIASPPAAARNVTVENFLPQQGWGG